MDLCSFAPMGLKRSDIFPELYGAGPESRTVGYHRAFLPNYFLAFFFFFPPASWSTTLPSLFSSFAPRFCNFLRLLAICFPCLVR